MLQFIYAFSYSTLLSTFVYSFLPDSLPTLLTTYLHSFIPYSQVSIHFFSCPSPYLPVCAYECPRVITSVYSISFYLYVNAPILRLNVPYLITHSLYHLISIKLCPSTNPYYPPDHPHSTSYVLSVHIMQLMRS